MKRSSLTPCRARLCRDRPASSSFLVQLGRDTRGASIVEYALVVSVVLVVAAPAVRAIGQRVDRAFQAVVATFVR